MSHNPTIPRCEYCRQLFVAGTRGGCVCCGAPAPDGQSGVLPFPSDVSLAILKTTEFLTDRQIEHIRAEWDALFKRNAYYKAPNESAGSLSSLVEKTTRQVFNCCFVGCCD